MADITIRLAHSDGDFEIARTLCREWLDWHWKAYPDDWPVEGNPMEPQRFETTLQELPRLHARPGGGILIAFADGHPVGCVMYNEAEAGVAVFNRMFVRESGRGLGAGRKMLERMFQEMIADGYHKVIFSSAKFLTHARTMYENAGFQNMEHPAGFPDDWRDYVYFMQRTLVSSL